MMQTGFGRAALLLALCIAAPWARAEPPLTVCMAEENPPLSWRAAGEMRGLDVRIARAIADELHRPLAIVPFESKYEADSTLSQEVNALLSSDVCQMASGFALIASDLGAPARPTARVPDYPGAKRPPERPWIKLGSLASSFAIMFFPVTLLGMYSPFAIRLLMRSPHRSGVVSGTVYGISTAGSIVGTLGTTFYLIPLIGSRAITISLGVAGVVAGLVLLATQRWSRWASEQPR